MNEYAYVTTSADGGPIETTSGRHIYLFWPSPRAKQGMYYSAPGVDGGFSVRPLSDLRTFDRTDDPMPIKRRKENRT